MSRHQAKAKQLIYPNSTDLFLNISHVTDEFVTGWSFIFK